MSGVDDFMKDWGSYFEPYEKVAKDNMRLALEALIQEQVKEAYDRGYTDKAIKADKFLAEQIRLARKKTLTDITIWANQEMANDHVQALKGDK